MKIRALCKRGHPRDLYDLWFVVTTLAELPDQVDEAVIAALVPRKFRPPLNQSQGEILSAGARQQCDSHRGSGLVRGGWEYGRLYTHIERNAVQWEPLLRGLVPDPPPFDQALTTVQHSLRFLRAVRPL